MLNWRKNKTDPGPGQSAATATPPAPATAADAPPPSPAAPVAGKGMAAALLEEGRISPEQFAAAMAEQARSGAFIGDVLVEQGVIDEGSLLSFLAKHCKVPHLSLLDYLIDANLAQLLPREVCLRHRVLPIDKLGRNLTVAMVNPLDTGALRVVQTHCPDLRIKPILCAHRHFEMVAGKLFNTATGNAPVSLSATSLGLMTRPGTAPAAAPVPQTPPGDGVAAPETDSAPPDPPVISAPPPDPEPEPTPADTPVTPDTCGKSTPTPQPPLDAPVLEEPDPAPVETPVGTPAEAARQSEAAITPPPPEVDPESEDEDEDAYPYAIAVPDDAEDGPLTEDALLRTAFQKPSAATPPPGAEPEKPDVMQDMAHAMINSLRGTYAILARRMELFRHIPPEHVARIFARGVTMEYEAGQTIFEKGELGDKMFAILIGEVEILDGDRLLAVLDRGDMFGEMALLGGALRSASAKARANTSVLALDQQAIRTLLPPEVTVQLLTNIVVTLSARLRDANEQLHAPAPPQDGA